MELGGGGYLVEIVFPGCWKVRDGRGVTLRCDVAFCFFPLYGVDVKQSAQEIGTRPFPRKEAILKIMRALI